MDQSKDAAGLVEMIRDIIDTKLSQIDKTVTCLVQSVNEDGTLNVSILPDTQTVLQNIINESKYMFNTGDYALLYMIKNRPSNSFVICKYNPGPFDVSWNADMQALQNNFNDAIAQINEHIDQISTAEGGAVNN